MLSSLHIENIAVIKLADIEFGRGLNVLTGETGAGKSIIIDSLMAILGGRVTRELIRRGCGHALVSAVFSPGGDADEWLRQNDLEPEEELIIQRRITPEGKSSCRVNGSPVAVNQLRELGACLIDIHGQNDGRRLLDEALHREFLDAFGAYEAELCEFSAAYDRYRQTGRELKSHSMDELEKERLTEVLQYTIDELERAGLREGEYDELSDRRDLLRNSEKLTDALDGAFEVLYGGEVSAVSLCSEAKSMASRASSFAPELNRALDSIESAGALLEDAAETLRDFRQGLDFSPGEYDALEARIALLRRLFKKYGREEAQLIAYLEECRQKLLGLEYSADRLIKLQKQLQKDAGDALSAGKTLHDARKRASEELSLRIERELRDLSMPSARFVVELAVVSSDAGFNKFGCDEVRFLMSANAGSEPGRISKIASGGELSRIMLAMKNVFAETDSVETLVFDEIDTGVSGVAAQRVGEKLGRLSRTKQVLCVTHLPQIAAMADRHYNILKSECGDETTTDVSMLSHEGRLREIARLHGGEVVTETTIKSAGEQLCAAEAFKENS